MYFSMQQRPPGRRSSAARPSRARETAAARCSAQQKGHLRACARRPRPEYRRRRTPSRLGLARTVLGQRCPGPRRGDQGAVLRGLCCGEAIRGRQCPRRCRRRLSGDRRRRPDAAVHSAAAEPSQPCSALRPAGPRLPAHRWRLSQCGDGAAMPTALSARPAATYVCRGRQTCPHR